MTKADEAVVVQVTPYFPPHVGGVERAVEIIAEGLVERHHKVEVLTTDRGSGGAERVARRGGLTVRRLRAFEIAHTPVAPALFGRLMRQPRGSIVHMHVAQAFVPEVVWMTSALRRRPFVAHYHLDVGPSGVAGRLLPAYKRLLLRRVLRSAAAVIALSDEQASELVDQYGCRPERVVTIPNGVPRDLGANPAERGTVDDEAADRASSDDREPQPEGPLRILFVGRISPQKNLPFLVEAVHAMTRDVELVVVGDGEDSQRVTGLVAGLGMRNVRLVGRVDHAELASWYRSADVFALTSDREGLPLAALEAMSFGLPVVGVDSPGLRELCAGVGVVVSGGVPALAAALDHLAQDPAERRRLSSLSLARAREADWDKSIGLIENLYGAIACR
jgi:phosphatidylinositol alpha-mannosyltransferase